MYVYFKQARKTYSLVLIHIVIPSNNLNKGFIRMIKLRTLFFIKLIKSQGGGGECPLAPPPPCNRLCVDASYNQSTESGIKFNIRGYISGLMYHNDTFSTVQWKTEETKRSRNFCTRLWRPCTLYMYFTPSHDSTIGDLADIAIYIVYYILYMYRISYFE